jgi:hypothetical protein
MKKKVLLGMGIVGLVCMLGLTGCSKEKRCRCAVLHSSNVRIVKIQSGNCEDLKLFRYHTPLDSLKVDSLLCTDYEFMIDSVYND